MEGKKRSGNKQISVLQHCNKPCDKGSAKKACEKDKRQPVSLRRLHRSVFQEATAMQEDKGSRFINNRQQQSSRSAIKPYINELRRRCPSTLWRPIDGADPVERHNNPSTRLLGDKDEVVRSISLPPPCLTDTLKPCP